MPRKISGRWILAWTGAVIIAVAVGCGSDSADNTSISIKPSGSQSGKSAEKEPELTSGQKNALEAGESYLDGMAFSKKGLIGQLSSPAGDGYSKADAKFAASHLGADWKAEAVEAAESYLDGMAFSKEGLYEQLSSPAGDQFTPAQARYAVDKVY